MLSLKAQPTPMICSLCLTRDGLFTVSAFILELEPHLLAFQKAKCNLPQQP